MRIADERAADQSEVARHLIDVAADHKGGERAERVGHDVVAASDREDEPVAAAAVVGTQGGVGGGVIGIGIHGVGAVELA